MLACLRQRGGAYDAPYGRRTRGQLDGGKDAWEEMVPYYYSTLEGLWAVGCVVRTVYG